MTPTEMRKLAMDALAGGTVGGGSIEAWMVHWREEADRSIALAHAPLESAAENERLRDALHNAYGKLDQAEEWHHVTTTMDDIGEALDEADILDANTGGDHE